MGGGRRRRGDAPRCFFVHRSRGFRTACLKTAPDRSAPDAELEAYGWQRNERIRFGRRRIDGRDAERGGQKFGLVTIKVGAQDIAAALKLDDGREFWLRARDPRRRRDLSVAGNVKHEVLLFLGQAPPWLRNLNYIGTGLNFDLFESLGTCVLMASLSALSTEPGSGIL